MKLTELARNFCLLMTVPTVLLVLSRCDRETAHGVAAIYEPDHEHQCVAADDGESQ